MLVLFAYKNLASEVSGSGHVFSVDLYPSACENCETVNRLLKTSKLKNTYPIDIHIHYKKHKGLLE